MEILVNLFTSATLKLFSFCGQYLTWVIETVITLSIGESVHFIGLYVILPLFVLMIAPTILGLIIRVSILRFVANHRARQMTIIDPNKLDI